MLLGALGHSVPCMGSLPTHVDRVLRPARLAVQAHSVAIPNAGLSGCRLCQHNCAPLHTGTVLGLLPSLTPRLSHPQLMLRQLLTRRFSLTVKACRTQESKLAQQAETRAPAGTVYISAEDLQRFIATCLVSACLTSILAAVLTGDQAARRYRADRRGSKQAAAKHPHTRPFCSLLHDPLDGHLWPERNL